MQEETIATAVHAFSLVFGDDPDRKHLFLVDSERAAKQWVEAIKGCAYQQLR